MQTQPTCSDYNKKFRYARTFFVLALLLFVLFFWNICAGSVQIPFQTACEILVGMAHTKTERTIIWQLRLPRAIAAIFLGGALSLSGYLLQTFFHNPIAGPFVLGISSGAKLMVSLVMVFCLKQAWAMGSFALIMAAFVGAMLSMGMVLLFSAKVKQMSMLVVCGVMIGYICSAITDFVVNFADDSDIVNLHNWSMGSFSGISWANVQVIVGMVGVTAICLLFLAKPMRAYQLGEAYAKSLGVNISLFRVILVFLSSLLSACVTAFAGPVSFVGIAVPQLVKKGFQTTKPQILLPACFLGGGVFCLFSDLIARTVFAPTELSISTVTAVFGAPVVLTVMVQQKRRTD